MNDLESFDLNKTLLKKMDLKKVILCDCTLREGEQSAGVGFDQKTKLTVSRFLSQIGIPQIQVGYPGISNKDKEMVKTIKNEGLNSKIESISMIHVDNWKEHIDAALECQVDVLSLQFGVSSIRLKYVLQLSEEAALDRIYKSIIYAKENGAYVSFTPTDATRAPLPFLRKVFQTIINAGADRVRIADSVGILFPMATRNLVREVRKIVGNKPIGIHCHNDFGLALANTISAVEAGVDIVDVTVNGLGERTGNASLDEVVMVVKFLYGMDLSIQTEKLSELSHLIENFTGIKVPDSKPIIGKNAFAHILDTHVMGMEKYESMYEPFNPKIVGNKRRFPLGRLSGPFAIKKKLKELNLTFEEPKIPLLVDLINKKAENLRREIEDSEFMELVNSLK